MDKVTLLPCPNPWCDCPNDLTVEPIIGTGMYGVECGCGFNGPVVPSDDAAITAWNTRATPAPDSEKLREALEQGRPFSEWHEDHGDVLWWKLPILESPYCGSPIDLGRSMKVVVQIGFEEHDLPITMTGGWPFSEDDEQDLWWTPLPKPTFYRAGASA